MAWVKAEGAGPSAIDGIPADQLSVKTVAEVMAVSPGTAHRMMLDAGYNYVPDSQVVMEMIVALGSIEDAKAWCVREGYYGWGTAVHRANKVMPGFMKACRDADRKRKARAIAADVDGSMTLEQVMEKHGVSARTVARALEMSR